MTKKTRAPKFEHGLTPEQIKQFQAAAQRTWETIAYDLLDANGGKSIPRSHVIEVVLDADYMKTYGRITDPGVEAFRTNYEPGAYEAKIALLKQTFTFSRYGM